MFKRFPMNCRGHPIDHLSGIMGRSGILGDVGEMLTSRPDFVFQKAVVSTFHECPVHSPRGHETT